MWTMMSRSTLYADRQVQENDDRKKQQKQKTKKGMGKNIIEHKYKKILVKE